MFRTDTPRPIKLKDYLCAGRPIVGTTLVAVLPTHRRRGCLRSMMARHLRKSRDRGDLAAALWAARWMFVNWFAIHAGGM